MHKAWRWLPVKPSGLQCSHSQSVHGPMGEDARGLSWLQAGSYLECTSKLLLSHPSPTSEEPTGVHLQPSPRLCSWDHAQGVITPPHTCSASSLLKLRGTRVYLGLLPCKADSSRLGKWSISTSSLNQTQKIIQDEEIQEYTPNETELSNLPGKELKTMVIKISLDLRKQ